MLEETGHLVSQTCEGEILFWDYPKEKAVKVRMWITQRIREKKENINCLCYVDESQILYVGTEETKILTFDISELYREPVHKGSVKMAHSQ